MYVHKFNTHLLYFYFIVSTRRRRHRRHHLIAFTEHIYYVRPRQRNQHHHPPHLSSLSINTSTTHAVHVNKQPQAALPTAPRWWNHDHWRLRMIGRHRSMGAHVDGDGFLPIREAASRLFAIVGCWFLLWFERFVMYLCLLAILAKPELRICLARSGIERSCES